MPYIKQPNDIKKGCTYSKHIPILTGLSPGLHVWQCPSCKQVAIFKAREVHLNIPGRTKTMYTLVSEEN